MISLPTDSCWMIYFSRNFLCPVVQLNNKNWDEYNYPSYDLSISNCYINKLKGNKLIQKTGLGLPFFHYTFLKIK